MRNFNPGQYKDLFDDWDDPVIQAHRAGEFKVIESIKNKRNKTFIDLGAGHGRILPKIAPIVKDIIAIELNPAMFKILNQESAKFKNSTAVFGDMTKLETILKKFTIVNPVLLLLENTLGTIEGQYQQVLTQMRKIAKQNHGEAIISLYRQQALKDWGLMSYWHGKAMNGEPDIVKTDLKKGLFVSKTGYTSKWWTDKEIAGMKNFFEGKLLNEVIAETYWIFHLGF